MIKTLLLLLARTLLEAAIVLFCIGALLLVFSVRLGRRVVTPGDDRLERMSGRAAQLAALLPRRPEPHNIDDEEEEVVAS